jgi:hypothetical protein
MAKRDYIAEAFAIEQFHRKVLERLVQSERINPPRHKSTEPSENQMFQEKIFVKRLAQACLRSQGRTFEREEPCTFSTVEPMASDFLHDVQREASGKGAN